MQTSLRRAIRPFSTQTANWGTNCTTFYVKNQTTPLLSQARFPIQNAISPAFARTRRRFSSSPVSQHEPLERPKPGEELKITFIAKEGDRHTFDVKAGDNLLDIALEYDLEMEGACGGSCACSTCHVIVEDESLYDKMDEPDDDENDMLDLAFGLTETSRLGCQVKMTKELDGLVVRLPSMTRNLQASDFQS
ncbi:ferredoxin [Lentithecium fluviatile CBS 122367]|uniref:Ferredoxin n=1 Tax=Lentithecium fluviatile CBS 122367 TaxID=1168545 RepID=A0A6G1IHS5_9PLEO|nr:ferredoxin [Lentithecium fluviatile CBS 122367]